MADEVAVSYAEYLQLDISKELKPIHQITDEMLTRLEEFEGLMKVVQSGSDDYTADSFIKILERKQEIDTLRSRIQYLEVVMNKVSDDLSTLEKQVETAEAHLGVPENKLKSFLKPILNKINKDSPSASMNEFDPATFVYKAPRTFSTSEYFQS